MFNPAISEIFTKFEDKCDSVMGKQILTLIISALALVSCGWRDDGLRELDKVIACKDYYRDSLLNSLGAVRRDFDSAGSDSLRWEYSRMLYSGYYHYSQDSSVKYQRLMERYASDPAQRLLTRMQKVRILLQKNEEEDAAAVFGSLDTTGLTDQELVKEYLHCEAVLCSALLSAGVQDEAFYRQRLRSSRTKSLEIDSTSFYARRMKAQLCRDNGDTLAAVSLLERLYRDSDDPHEKASTAYNLAKIHEKKGDEDARFEWLVRSAVNDFRSAERTYMSLYELALVLYDKGRLRKAEQYISLNLMDVISGNFSKRLGDSGKANLIISDTVQRMARSRNRWLTVGICLVLVLLVVILRLLQREVRHREQMKETNSKLLDANKIRNGYVFRYMALSVHYIDKIGETRNEIRSLAKSDGLDAVMKALRSPAAMYNEYENYYQIFDETFLGIYPDFVEKVNALLSEDARFDLHGEKTLPTELRILAAIRIGITESGKIAKFLKCSPNTVYTYRAKLKRSALCPKENFEAEIAKI